jgi:ATP phosphoribosyltransferase regulatory subunit
LTPAAGGPEPELPERNPSGTRDFLPDEMRELRALTSRMLEVFDGAGYGEVLTPALEYERTFSHLGARPAYRMFDERGDVLVLRSDMTVPIARVAATRFAGVPHPLRFCYLAPVYRNVLPQRGHSREFLQAGVELIGAPGAPGTAEVLTLLCRALEAAGLGTFRVALGDASLFPGLLAAVGVQPAVHERILAELVRGDFVALAAEIEGLAVADADAELLLRVASLRGGPDILEEPAAPLQQALGGLRELHALLPRDVAARMIFDLGLVRSLGYYTGAVFQVLDPASGVPIGNGGRYDELLGAFGAPAPAVGFALNAERVHIAAASAGREAHHG